MQPQSSHDGNKLPVFVFPTALTFYGDDQTSHKQILTLYNPYEFPLKFNVLCTSPRKYAVVDPKGTIKSACCVDIVIRHNAVLPSNYETCDKFRIQIREHGSRSVFGKKDIPAILHSVKPTSTLVQAQDDHFEPVAPSTSVPHNREYAFGSGSRTAISTTAVAGPSLVVVLAGIVSLIALALPTDGQNDARLPVYLHLSVPQKLVAAFTLGLVAMSILKS